MNFDHQTFSENPKIIKTKKIKTIKIKINKNPTKNKKINSYKNPSTTSGTTTMQSLEDIDNIYEDFFSDIEDDESNAPVSVQRLLEPENMKEWQRIGFGSAFEVKVDDVEKKLLQVAIKEAKVISGRIFQELKKR